MFRALPRLAGIARERWVSDIHLALVTNERSHNAFRNFWRCKRGKECKRKVEVNITRVQNCLDIKIFNLLFGHVVYHWAGQVRLGVGQKSKIYEVCHSVHLFHFLSLNNERGISKDFKHILPLLCKLLAIHIWSWHPSLWKKRDQYLKSFVEKKTVRLVFCQGETNFAKFSILAILENSRAKVSKRKLCQNFIIFFLSKLLMFLAAIIF